jgi:RNA polymerase sigma factor (sigma-70 family)
MSPRDTLLLEQWVACRDAEAFNQLVARYADLVYAACSRILRNDADAQDAAQECFLSLAQTNDEIRSSLGGWLHTVATRRALNLLKQNKRRREREQRYTECAATQTESTWDDIQDFVDEAIAALPEEQRVVIIAHFLEHQTGEAVAQAHGISRRAVTYRIQKGVEAIRESLAKRGIPVAAGTLSTMLATNTAEAAPAALAATLGKIALAGTKAFPKAAAPVSWMAAGYGGKLAGGLLLIALVLAAVVGVTTYGMNGGEEDPDAVQSAVFGAAQESPQPEPGESPAGAESRETLASAEPDSSGPLSVRVASDFPEPSTEEPSTSAPPNADAQAAEPFPCTISGSVIDTGGYPIAGANVVVANIAPAWAVHNGGQAYRATTDHAGLFTVRGVCLSGSVIVMASHTGYAAQQKRMEVETGVGVENVSLTLAKGVMLRGRVLGTDGEPIGDALVYTQAYIFESRSASSLNALTAITAKDGRFTAGFEGEGTVGLEVATPDHGAGVFLGIEVGPAEEVEFAMPEPASVSGVITHADGRPASDLRVSLSGISSYTACAPGRNYTETKTFSVYCLNTSTDDAGRYAVSGVTPSATYRASVSRVENYKPVELSSFEELGVVKPGEAFVWNHTLREYMAVSGHIYDERSGRPLGYMVIKYARDEARAKGESTQMDGSFERHFFEPGTYTLYPAYFFGDSENLKNAHAQVLNWTPGERRMVDFRIPGPFSLAVRVVDSHGTPVEGVNVYQMRKIGFIRIEDPFE